MSWQRDFMSAHLGFRNFSKNWGEPSTLVSRSGHLVAKQDLMREIWGDAVVQPGNLAVIISVLRKALGEDGAEHKYIQTVSKLVGDVRETRESTVAASEPPPVIKSSSPLFRRLSISQVALSLLPAC